MHQNLLNAEYKSIVYLSAGNIIMNVILAMKALTKVLHKSVCCTYACRQFHFFIGSYINVKGEVMKQNCFISVLFISVLLLSLAVLQAEAKERTVIFDQGHGQKFVIEKEGDLQLSGLAGLLRKEGYEVKVNAGQLNDAALNAADVLLISGAFQPFSPEEINAIIRHLERGGRLCVMLHIPQPLTALMNRLKVYASNGVIQEEENTINNTPKEFFITKMEKHEITKGLKKIGVHGAWALMTDGTAPQIIAWTSPKAWIDLNRDGKFNETDVRQSFGVIIAGTLGKGRYIIFGDDAIFQNKFLDQENMPLAKNVADWMR